MNTVFDADWHALVRSCTARVLRLSLTSLAFLGATACAVEDTRQVDQVAQQPVTNSRSVVERQLGGLSRALRDNSWSRMDEFFSRDYKGGLRELEDMFDTSRRNERITDMQFILNRVLESSGSLNVQVRWNKAYLDALGRPQMKSGTAELIMDARESPPLITDMRGDRFF